MTDLEKAARQALEALENPWKSGPNGVADAITALRQALEKPADEPVASMPSNTRYTVEVEGHARTYWDNIHDAITNAQRAVYASVNATTRAIDDLQAGRMAEWSYGFSAVRIYPPDTRPQPAREWVGLTDEEIKRKAFYLRWVHPDEYLILLGKALDDLLKEKNT